MTVDLAEALDNLYKGENEKVSQEALQVIVPVLRLSERGTPFREISKEVGITLEQVRDLVVRDRGWQAGERQQRGQRSR